MNKLDKELEKIWGGYVWETGQHLTADKAIPLIKTVILEALAEWEVKNEPEQDDNWPDDWGKAGDVDN